MRIPHCPTLNHSRCGLEYDHGEQICTIFVVLAQSWQHVQPYCCSVVCVPCFDVPSVLIICCYYFLHVQCGMYVLVQCSMYSCAVWHAYTCAECHVCLGHMMSLRNGSCKNDVRKKILPVYSMYVGCISCLHH